MADEEITTEETTEEGVAEVPAEPERQLPEQATLAAIVADHHSATWEIADDEWVVTVDASEYHSLARTARFAGFEAFVDLCAVDYFRARPRYQVMLTLLSYTEPMRLRIKVGADREDPTVASVTDLFAGANFYERETYDLLGIDFTGHPDLTRILMPDDWVGHPLRKDYAVGTVPVQFKDAPKVQ